LTLAEITKEIAEEYKYELPITPILNWENITLEFNNKFYPEVPGKNEEEKKKEEVKVKVKEEEGDKEKEKEKRKTIGALKMQLKNLYERILERGA